MAMDHIISSEPREVAIGAWGNFALRDDVSSHLTQQHNLARRSVRLRLFTTGALAKDSLDDFECGVGGHVEGLWTVRSWTDFGVTHAPGEKERKERG